MSSTLCRLTTDDLKQLSAALRSGRLGLPLTAFALRRFISPDFADAISSELQERANNGYSSTQLADLADVIIHDRAEHGFARDLFDLVWTGPETGGIANRDTGVVVRELFHSANKSVMLAGYAVYQGHMVFRALADRMEQIPDLGVRMFLDVRRPDGDTCSEAEVVRRFAARFKEKDWPGSRLPELYYDPRAVDLDPHRRASLHAKCIVVDEMRAFISSANFTEAAQLRNIEVGVLVRSPALACQLMQHFETLAAAGLLKPIPLG